MSGTVGGAGRRWRPPPDAIAVPRPARTGYPVILMADLRTQRGGRPGTAAGAILAW